MQTPKILLAALLLLAIVPMVSASAPDGNITRIDGSADNASLPAFSYYRDGNLTIDFNVQDFDTNGLLVDLNYSTSNLQGTGTVIVNDLNLSTLPSSGAWNCQDTNFEDSTQCSIDWNISAITDGNYYILLYINDGAETNFNASDNNFMVDNTKPSTSWDGNNNAWQKTDANIHLTCSDGNGSGCNTTKYRLDTDSNTGVSMGNWQEFDQNILISSDGNWAIDFNSTDNSENIGDTNTFYVLVDKTAPNVSISSPSNGALINSTTVTLVYSGTDANSGILRYWVRADSTAWINNGTNTSYDFTGQSNGPHSYSVIATDNADNNSSTASVSVTVDLNADVNIARIDGNPDNLPLPAFSYYRDGNLTIDVNIQDADSNNLLLDLNYSASSTRGTGTVIVNNLDINRLPTTGAWNCADTNFQNITTCSIDWNIASISDGNYFILATLDDIFTLKFNTSDNNFMVDNTKPSTTWDGNHNSWQKTDANIHLTCSDGAGSGCATTKYRLDTDPSATIDYGAWQDYGTNILITSDGSWAIDFNSTDNVGNIGNTNTFYVLVDKTAPSASITSPSPGATITSSTVTLVYSGSDANAGILRYWVQADSSAWINNGTNTSYDFTGQSNGSHTYTVIATDNADNNSSMAQVIVTVNVPSGDGGGGDGGDGGGGGGGGSGGDTVPPTISWLKPDANAVLSGKVELRVQVNDNNGVKSVSFYVDGTNPSNLLTRIYYSGSNQIEFEWDTARVSNGNHDIFARADDWSNNQAQISRKIKVQNAAGSQGNDQNASPEEQSAKAALANAKTEQQKAKAAIDLAKQFKLDFSAAQGKYSEGNSKLNAGQKACNQKNFSDCETKSNEAIPLFQEAASKTGLVLESSKLMGEPGALDFKGIFSASKLNPALAAFAEEIQSQMATERHLIVFKRTTEDGNSVFFVRVELKIKNNSGADSDFILVELVPKALTQSSDELVGTPDFVILEKDPLLEWKLNGFKNGEEITVSYTIDKTFSEQEIQALLNSSELNSYQLAPLIVKASAVQNTPLLLVPTSLLGLEFLANPTVLAIIIGIIVILAFVFLAWQKNKAPRWPGRSAW